jgi:F-type H+-transporting ATPase subunit a
LQPINNRNKMARKTLLFLLITIFSSVFLWAEQGEVIDTSKTETKENVEQESFNPGNVIIEHIIDAYEWHITTIGQTHISIPLPVILYSKYSGFHVFWSSKFHHGEQKYLNFEIAKGGPYKSKIIEILPDGTVYRPIDLSITKTVFAAFITMLLMLWIFLAAAKRYKADPLSPPKGIQSWVEPIIIFIRDDVAKSSIGEKKFERYVPFLLTVFIFIWFNNMLGIIPIFPGGANVTGNITVTGTLALFTFLITTFSGNKHYWKEIFNPEVPLWLKFPIPLMPLIEFMGIFIKPFVLMVRLFANISAGHIVALGFYVLIFVFGHMNIAAGYGVSVVSVAFTVFLALLELLVAFIQAFVFTLLSALYFGMATAEHH